MQDGGHSGCIASCKMTMQLGLLLVGCLLLGESTGQCPAVCTCLPGNTMLICSGTGVTEVPDFPASIRQAATEMYDMQAIKLVHSLRVFPLKQKSSHKLHQFN